MSDYVIPSTWHTLQSSREQWRDAPQNDERLATLMQMAEQQVLAFGLDQDDTATQIPLPVDGSGNTIVPVNFRAAQLAQAQNLYNAAQVDAGGQIGDDSFVISPRPLDWVIKQMIRPATGALGVVG